ncbi:MAG TPA: hypothetical protein VFN23_05830 [Ktedonobacteraceae bacterium]|nr:hypothetical protein [Ktedonobacteraceae bacterium]
MPDIISISIGEWQQYTSGPGAKLLAGSGVSPAWSSSLSTLMGVTAIYIGSRGEAPGEVRGVPGLSSPYPLVGAEKLEVSRDV